MYLFLFNVATTKLNLLLSKGISVAAGEEDLFFIILGSYQEDIRINTGKLPESSFLIPVWQPNLRRVNH
jgi:hypothetical protein